MKRPEGVPAEKWSVMSRAERRAWVAHDLRVRRARARALTRGLGGADRTQTRAR